MLEVSSEDIYQWKFTKIDKKVGEESFPTPIEWIKAPDVYRIYRKPTKYFWNL